MVGAQTVATFLVITLTFQLRLLVVHPGQHQVPLDVVEIRSIQKVECQDLVGQGAADIDRLLIGSVPL